MSSARNDGYPDAVLLNSVKYIIEGEISKDDSRGSFHLSQVPTSASSPVSSTLASMATLQNIDVSKSAPHAILPTISNMENHVDKCPRSLTKPHEAYSLLYATEPGIESVEFRQKRAKAQNIHSNHKILRRGKWTQEEEEYANAVVREFNSGFLDAQAGTTLRIYLSEKLQCDPMRITKKFTGNDSIGKRVFQPCGRIGDGLSKEAKNAQNNLEALYTKWKQRLSHQDQEYARKTMAAQAVSHACTLQHDEMLLTSNIPRAFSSIELHHFEARKTEKAIHKTATWLSRAAGIDTKTISNTNIADIENKLRIISSLIQESPTVLAATVDLSRAKGNQSDQCCMTTPDVRKRKFSVERNLSASPTNPMKLLASISSHAVPVPIDQQNYEDAQTLVNFIKSVTC